MDGYAVAVNITNHPNEKWYLRFYIQEQICLKSVSYSLIPSAYHNQFQPIDLYKNFRLCQKY